MDETTDHPSLQSYLEEARALWDDEDLPPDADQLRELAESIDMDHAASEAADRRAAELSEEAQQAVDNGEQERACSMLRDAVLLSPVRLQPHYLLANIYAERWSDSDRHLERDLAMELAERAQDIDPEHVPTRNLIEKLGHVPQDGLPWKKAAMIVIVIVAISGSMQLCHRYLVAPEVDQDEIDEVRETLEEHGEPPR